MLQDPAINAPVPLKPNEGPPVGLKHFQAAEGLVPMTQDECTGPGILQKMPPVSAIGTVEAPSFLSPSSVSHLNGLAWTL